MQTRSAHFALLAITFFPAVATVADDSLPGTKPLEWPEAELADRMMDGAHRFVERKIDDAAKNRHRDWPATDASSEDWQQAAKENREHLRKIVGAVDERLPPHFEYFGDTPDRTVVFANENFRIAQVRWAVLDGVFAEGLHVTPTVPSLAAVVLVPDADQTPEQLLGIADGIPADSQIARRLIANRVEAIIPTMVSRQKLETDDSRLKRSDQTNREWIYRQAFHMGRHIIGYEVQKVLAALDYLEAKRGDASKPIGVAGYGEGGLIAFYAAALDTRIDAALVSGYFDSREALWSEPIYRNVWSLLKRFGDAEIASLILPRSLIVEHSPTPTITGHKGELTTADFSRVRAEIDRVRGPSGSDRPILVHGEDGATCGPYSLDATRAFLQVLGAGIDADPVASLSDSREAFDPATRQQRTVQQLEDHVQGLVRQSEHVRDRFMLYELMPELNDSRWSTEKRHPVHDSKKFIDGAREFRRRFHEEAIGRFDEPMLPPNARTRKVAETDAWTAYDVVLDVHEDLFAWGVLVLPNDLKPGEKRPVVVCQHGRNGVPRDAIDAQSTAYNDFAARLAERGFITFAPHNLYRGEDRYRVLDRKANSIGCSLFSFIVAQHDQILRWLDSQPFVDGERIAFYGLSYGGETAVRVPTILEKYCLSICSGDFNQWTRKVAATDQPFSFMRSIEWEMPYWNLGHTFDYAEMTYLMIPRPFMVERGHHDRVGRDRWVAHEFAKVRWLYAQLGLADRVEIEFFQGGHSINGEGTFAFLHKHLDWPASDRQTADNKSPLPRSGGGRTR
jgi:dienelactone hydrolase